MVKLSALYKEMLDVYGQQKIETVVIQHALCGNTLNDEELAIVLQRRYPSISKNMGYRKFDTYDD